MSAEFTFETLRCNGQDIHTAFIGKEDAPVIVMLHGFPEYWTAWADVATHLADSYRLVLPDQRGVNRSSKPSRVEDYAARHLVSDMVALVDQVSPNRPVILCGHDWGASVAYAIAMRHSERVSALIIANGVHPTCFQKALYEEPEQRAASQYIRLLRQPGAGAHMAKDGFARTLRMFEKFSSAPWLDEQRKGAFVKAWSHEDAITTMLHWYSSSPLEVPDVEEPARAFPITVEMRRKFAICVPHLLLWGMDDTALLPSARQDLTAFAGDLTVQEIEGASHWILHEKPLLVADAIRSFVQR